MKTGLKRVCWTLLAMAALGAVVTNAQCLIISEVVDGDLSGGNPKFVEITNTSGTDYTFTEGGIIIQSNASTDRNVDIDLTGVTIPAGTAFVIAQTTSQSAFQLAYGFDANLYSGSGYSNGDDRYIITDTADGSNLLDICGEIDVDGTGSGWEYLDGYGYRNNTVNTGNNGVFVLSEWTFGNGALDAPNDTERIALLQQYTTPGSHDYPVGCGGGTVGACCHDTACTVETEANCIADGGVYLGDGTNCDGDPCGTPPPTGACCIEGECSLLSEADCLAAGGEYQGDDEPCTPNPCLTCTTIPEAKLLPSGSDVQLCDLVIASTADLVGSSNSKCFQAQEQDYSGGITVYGSNADIDAILGSAFAGDTITITGTTDEYNGLFELTGPFAFTVGANVGIPTPVAITAAEITAGGQVAEDLESMLVVVECATFEDAGGTFAGFTNYNIVDSTGTCVLRVTTNDLDLVGETIPSAPVDITGVLGQYGGHQLQIRSISDIFEDPECVATGACCDGETCTMESEIDCTGTWMGGGTTCEPWNPCVTPYGACCVAGSCSLMTEPECVAAGGGYIGDYVACGEYTCAQPVQSGDIALGLNNENPVVTAEQIRGGVQVGSWSAVPYLQSMEFDNAAGTLHNAEGNLLALDFGDPDLTTGVLYNLATDGSNRYQELYRWDDTDPDTQYDDFLTNICGLSVSPDNNYVAAWGTTWGFLYVLEYDAGATPGTGTGASLGDKYVWTGISVDAGTQGTAWLDNDTVLTYNIAWATGNTVLYTIDFNPTNPPYDTFTQTERIMFATPSAGDGSEVTDVEYNPEVSPYIYCMHSTYSGTSYTTLSIIDPATWSLAAQLNLGGSMETGREIALGPDMRLYLSQYRGYVDYVVLDVDEDGDIDADDVALMTDDSAVDYYNDGEFASYNGLDVAFSDTPVGACCIAGECSVVTEAACLTAGGTYQGDDTSCIPDPCVECSTIPQMRLEGPDRWVRTCEVVVTSTVDLVNSENVATFHVQETDGSGGLAVAGYTEDIEALLTQLTVGDSITIQGYLDEYASLLQLEGPYSFFTNHGAVGAPAPTVITTADLMDHSVTGEGLESMLVTLECVSFVDTGVFAGGTNYAVTDGVNEVTVRIATNELELVGADIPTGQVNITGIFSQFSFGDPDVGYQLLPRFVADFSDCAAQGCPGDMDCDGDVDFDDIDPFVLALGGEAGYLAQYPDCRWLNADADVDGDVDFDDIDAFVALIGTTCD